MPTKKKQEKKHITVKQANALIDKYYALKRALYAIGESESYYDSVRKDAKSAMKALEKWRSEKLNVSRMSNYKA